MSWHFSQALVAEYSADTCSGGAPSAPSSGNPIPQAYLSPDRMTAFSRLSRFGMTFAPLMENLGEDVLMWCREASRAKTLAQPEKAQESTEQGRECGTTWHGSLARYDRATSSWKTPQCSLLEGLDEFSETWPRWGMMRNGACLAQSMPAHLISATESGLSELWPTPCLPGNGGSNGKAKMKAMLLPTPLASLGTNGGPNQRDSSGRPGLQMAAMMWPTPTVCGNYNQKGMSPTSGDGLATAVKLWPMPCATDHKGSGKTGTLRDRLDYAAERGATKSNTYATPQARDFRSGSTERWDNPERSRNLNDQVGGQLNPTWVEKLMGWPKNWTSLNPMIDSDFISWIMGFCEHEKTRTNQALHLLRRSTYAQSFQRKTGRPFGIQEAEILLSHLREHPHRFDEAWIQLAGAEAPEAEVRGVRAHADPSGSPLGSEHPQQLTGEHSDAVQTLSRFLAHDGQEAWADGSWEDAIPRTSVGVAARVDRLKAIGNGQVSSVAALAWKTLTKNLK